MRHEDMDRLVGSTAAEPATVAEAVERAAAIRDAVVAVSPFGAADGMAAHADLFGEILGDVGRALERRDARGGLRDTDFATRLVLEVVARYLRAVRTHAADPGSTPRCWALLFDRSDDPSVPPAQMAAVGVNASRNYDLADALLATWEAFPPTRAQRADVDRLRAIMTERLEDPAGELLGGARSAWAAAGAARRSSSRAAAARMNELLDRLVTPIGAGLLATGVRPEPVAGSGGAPSPPDRDAFQPRDLYRSRILRPLFDEMRRAGTPDGVPDPVHRVMIDLNMNHPDGERACHAEVIEMVGRAVGVDGPAAARPEGVVEARTMHITQYVVADLTEASVRRLAELDEERATRGGTRAIYRIWPDFRTTGQTDRSTATVKADAARISFAARGQGIVWAVLDSGIDGAHPHFATHGSLDVEKPIAHLDLSARDTPGTGPTDVGPVDTALTDTAGHGTHVAAIIAGEMVGAEEDPIVAVRADIDGNGDVHYEQRPVPAMSGMAPLCKLVSYKVLDDNGDGEVSSIVTALQHIGEINNHGRDIKIHGVNLSVGYAFDPEWFACGESPLCVEVTRLVRAGVVVVVSAGNTGYGFNQDRVKGNVAAGLDMTINDPGNAELAITVGSTHRDAPYRYGVSYFSSKGPTGDGRAKPDLVAPGERILSAAAGAKRTTVERKPGFAGRAVHYVEDSGTSMAAAHVSGVIAAFLSIRREYIGHPDRVKEIFTSTAGDLGRVPQFQGRGLVDLMRAIQSV